MTRLQEVEQLIDSNLEIVNQYTKRAAELMGSIRTLEKERDKLMKKAQEGRVIKCKDCIKMNRNDCPMCYIEKQTLQFVNVSPNFFCGSGCLKEGK